jgi:hypothetical protein
MSTRPGSTSAAMAAVLDGLPEDELEPPEDELLVVVVVRPVGSVPSPERDRPAEAVWEAEGDPGLWTT